MDQLANKLSILIKDKKLREKMGKESYKIALKDFDSSIINAQTLEVYNELVSEIV